MKQLYGKASSTQISARYAATQALFQVMSGQSLNQALPPLEARVSDDDRGFLRDLALGSCRYFQRLNAIAKMLLKTPFGEEDQDLHALMVIGLYQLEIQKKAPHAAVHATVDVCEEMGKGYAKSVVNACLRRYGREYESLTAPLEDNPVTATSHPKWLLKMMKKAWPEHWAEVFTQNNQRPPLCLRVNQRHGSREDYLQRLQQAGIEAHPAEFAPFGIYLAQSCDVTQLPGFEDGDVSVQDEAAQLASLILAPQPGENILDACAAPGGKTCALLEAADCAVTALDLEASRLERVEENLERLGLFGNDTGLSASVVCADMANTDEWWEGQQYDAILLDAPCSASGVIRRHPDIKLLRRSADIAQLADVQAQLLNTAWDLLKPGGRLLYATCSVLPQENSDQIERFMADKLEARQGITLQALNTQLTGLDKLPGVACNAGQQLFPQENGHDGFFYALLVKG
ncbi:16S rRNA (cytosine(967)-C(5))-methyltransferase RsmB [Bacterioplanoides sp.]|uniref:16S rRNA (cytosine(967)-C(5))-methyltransferase RsmB n=1 Tax=Bacterioplanoides sp. TaxID=2066072 RepID=UPI003B0016DD